MDRGRPRRRTDCWTSAWPLLGSDPPLLSAFRQALALKLSDSSMTQEKTCVKIQSSKPPIIKKIPRVIIFNGPLKLNSINHIHSHCAESHPFPSPVRFETNKHYCVEGLWAIVKRKMLDQPFWFFKLLENYQNSYETFKKTLFSTDVWDTDIWITIVWTTIN